MTRIVLEGNIRINQSYQVTGSPFESLGHWQVRKGEIITLTDSFGSVFRARITKIWKDMAEVFVFESMSYKISPHKEIALFQALPNKERMELIIEKTTELGVTTIVPFKSRRSISIEDRDRKQKKTHRWPYIALKAAKQCRRATIPEITPFYSFKEALEKAKKYPLKLILWEKERRHSLRDVLREGNPERVAVMVGPEGGFEEEEVELARGSGFIPVSLCNMVLRTETAAITILGIIQYEMKAIE